MKGLTHFITGLTAGTFFPAAVNMAYNESSFVLVLGGIFGILPDTVDFKWDQFFEKYDYKIDPDPQNPDPQKMADIIAKAINEAHGEKKVKKILFMTIKKAADIWHQYRISFDLDNRKVKVILGPWVNTSKKPFPGTEPEGELVGEADLNCDIYRQVYDRDTYVDIMSGPSFDLVPMEDGKIKLDFLSWHRRWSHSLTFGVFCGFLCWLIMGFFVGFSHALIYGLVATAGLWAHVIEDQFGYMGSNLLWPFTKDKTVGFKSMHSGDAWPNFSTIWVCLALIVFNLNRFRVEPVFDIHFLVYISYTIVVPLTALHLIDKMLTAWEAREDEKTLVKLHQTEVLEEVEDGFA